MADVPQHVLDYQERRRQAEENRSIGDRAGEMLDDGVAALKRGNEIAKKEAYEYHQGTYKPEDTLALRNAGRLGREKIDQGAELARKVNESYAEEDAGIRQRLGGGPTQAGVMGQSADAAANALDELLLAGDYAPSSPNPLHPIRELYAGQMGDLLGQRDTQTQELHQAQQNEMQAHANAYAQEAGRQEAAIAVQEAKAQRDMERRNEALQKSQLVMSKVTQAADRLNESPDIDPNRYWASQSAGRKFGWGLSAALLGFAGLNPTGALQEAIARDIDAQKANFAQKQAGFGARMEEMGASRSVYQDLREAIGDEQATDMAMEHARLTQAETAFKAMAVKEGIPVQIAEQNLFLNEWRQRRSEIERGLAEMMATTPERIGGGWVPTVRGPRREVLEDRRDRLAKRGDRMAELDVTEGGQDRRQIVGIEGQERVEGIKASGRARAAEAKVRAKGAETLAARVQDPQDAIAIIDNLLELSEKSGGGVPGQFGPLKMPNALASDEQVAWEGDAAGLRLLTQKWASGAHLSESQFEQVEKMLPTDSELTGGRAIVKLRNLKKFMQGISKSRQRGFDESTRRFYHRADDLPSVDPYYTPEDGGDPVEVDED